MTSGIGIERIAQVAVTVRNVERARDFYRDVLGLQHMFDAPPRMSFFACGGTRLLLGEAEPDATVHGTSILYFAVPDLGAAHAQLRDREVEFVQEPHRVADLGDRVLWLAFFRDSEGNVMALSSEVPKA
jgi:methylmalonyl-CoA/ethylmalonyl-CoA epimerase